MFTNAEIARLDLPATPSPRRTRPNDNFAGFDDDDFDNFRAAGVDLDSLDDLREDVARRAPSHEGVLYDYSDSEDDDYHNAGPDYRDYQFSDDEESDHWHDRRLFRANR